MENSYFDNPFVPPVRFELIPISELVSNQDYQRNISMTHVKRAAEHFDLCQINPVKVSRRDGVNYVFNGQHTIEIVAAVSQSRETPVWCMVFTDLEYTREADIFANQLKYTKTLRPYEIFMANIEAGNEDELIVKSIVEAYHMEITPNKSMNGICAVNTLLSIYHRYGANMLDRTLALCIATWEGEMDSFSSFILRAVSTVLVCYGDALDEEVFKNKIGKVSLKSIIRAARERNNGSLGYAEALVFEYNKKLKNPLKLSLLYTMHNKKPRQQIHTIDEIIRQEQLTELEESKNEPKDEEGDNYDTV